jgi:cytochrome d ubiquinol oxidase subunit I
MKKDIFKIKWVLYGFIVLGFLGMFTMEDGWYTAEVARVPYILLMPYNSAGQPIIAGHYGVMSIAQAASYSPIVWYIGIVVILFYLILIPFTFYFNAKVLNLSNLDEDLRKAERELNIPETGKDAGSVNAGAR